MGGDADATVRAAANREPAGRYRPDQRRAPPPAGLRDRLRGQPSLHGLGAHCSPTTPPPPRRAASSCGEEGAGTARNGFERRLGEPRPGPGSPIAGASYRLTGPAGSTAANGSGRGGGSPRCGEITVPGPGAYSLGRLASRRGRQRVALERLRGRRCSSTTSAPRCLPSHRDRGAPGDRRGDRHRSPFGSGRRGDLLPAGGAQALDSAAVHPAPLPRAPGRSRATRPLPLRPGPARPLSASAPRSPMRPATAPASTRRSDGSAMVLRAPLKRRTCCAPACASGVAGGRRLKVPYGARPTLTGRLRRRDGAGLAGRRLRIAIRPARGSLAGPRLRHARTGPGGRFRVELGAGTSRRIRVSFAGSRGARPATAPRRLRLLVRAGVELQRLAPGPSNRRVAAAERDGPLRARRGCPRAGKLVMVEYLERAGGRWAPVLLTRAGREGRFRARYRFRYVSGVARIRLRALAPPEQGWPYAAGASAPLTRDRARARAGGSPGRGAGSGGELRACLSTARPAGKFWIRNGFWVPKSW